MARGKLVWVLVCCYLAAGCDPVPVQYPPGSVPQSSANPGTGTLPQPRSTPAGGTQSPPPVSGGQRGQYVWDKVMQGMAMGSSVAGPYGAGVGLIFGGLFGLFTADAHYAELNAQIQSEQQKDKTLEAQIEKEMEHQRKLEAQLETPVKPADAKPKEKLQTTQVAQGAVKESKSAPTVSTSSHPGPIASLSKRETSSSQPRHRFKNVDARDINQDGTLDLFIYYNPRKPGEIIRQEEDTNGDGKVDTWSSFNEGKLARREVDTQGNGTPDTVYYYKDDQIAREERDDNGDGQPAYRALYQNGHLAKVEKDIDRDGKIDLWTTYDTSQTDKVVLKEERDLNSDGAVDLWSYYKEGRLVRRDVSAVGLEHLSKKEKSLPEVPTETAPKS
ncbi:MAG: hypothetical protein ACE5HC_08445 [Candidatus Binatia bacterium]